MMRNQPDEIERFAVGRNVVDGCPCPALAAGYDPSQGDPSTTVAGRFDRQITGPTTVDREYARTVWFNVMRKLKAQYGVESTEYQTAEDIAYTIGWL